MRGDVLARRQSKDVFMVKREGESGRLERNGEENEMKGYRVKGIYSARGGVCPLVRV